MCNMSFILWTVGLKVIAYTVTSSLNYVVVKVDILFQHEKHGTIHNVCKHLDMYVPIFIHQVCFLHYGY